jgi:hypothetical protein
VRSRRRAASAKVRPAREGKVDLAPDHAHHRERAAERAHVAEPRSAASSSAAVEPEHLHVEVLRGAPEQEVAHEAAHRDRAPAARADRLGDRTDGVRIRSSTIVGLVTGGPRSASSCERWNTAVTGTPGTRARIASMPPSSRSTSTATCTISSCSSRQRSIALQHRAAARHHVVDDRDRTRRAALDPLARAVLLAVLAHDEEVAHGTLHERWCAIACAIGRRRS